MAKEDTLIDTGTRDAIVTMILSADTRELIDEAEDVARLWMMENPRDNVIPRACEQLAMLYDALPPVSVLPQDKSNISSAVVRAIKHRSSHNEKSHGRRYGGKPVRWERFEARGFKPATDDDRKRLSIPPAWNHVQVDNSDGAALLAVGIDKKGREQRIYSPKHHENQAAAKFARIKELHNRLPAIDDRLLKDSADNDTALAALLIRRTGLRPGSEQDTGAEKKALGATNLRVGNATVNGFDVRLRFVGKKGVSQDVTVNDPVLARLISERQEGKGHNDRLLDTDERKLRDYMKGVSPGVKPKDFRTYLGTATAKEMVDSIPPPKDAKEYKKKRQDVAKRVSAMLGNTPSVALTSYIAPSVFGAWEMAS